MCRACSFRFHTPTPRPSCRSPTGASALLERTVGESHPAHPARSHCPLAQTTLADRRAECHHPRRLARPDTARSRARDCCYSRPSCFLARFLGLRTGGVCSALWEHADVFDRQSLQRDFERYGGTASRTTWVASVQTHWVAAWETYWANRKGFMRGRRLLFAGGGA